MSLKKRVEHSIDLLKNDIKCLKFSQINCHRTILDKYCSCKSTQIELIKLKSEKVPKNV